MLVWNNGEDPFREGGLYKRVTDSGLLARRVLGDGVHGDVGVFGRYVAIEYARGDVIYVQDDDCIVSDPQALVDAWQSTNNTNTVGALPRHNPPEGFVVCNMPANFRARHFYDEHSLVGFGGVFHRDAPARAFDRFLNAYEGTINEEHFWRTCDIVFTALTPRVLVDIEYVDMEWASADNRMWKQPWHQAVRDEMLEKVLRVRDA